MFLTPTKYRHVPALVLLYTATFLPLMPARAQFGFDNQYSQSDWGDYAVDGLFEKVDLACEAGSEGSRVLPEFWGLSCPEYAQKSSGRIGFTRPLALSFHGSPGLSTTGRPD